MVDGVFNFGQSTLKVKIVLAAVAAVALLAMVVAADADTGESDGDAGDIFRDMAYGVTYKITKENAATNEYEVEVRRYWRTSILPMPSDAPNPVIPSTVINAGKTYTVTAIGAQAFMDNRLIVSVSIPSTVKIIGYASFFTCTSLTTITDTSNVVTIMDYAFYGCIRLGSIDIPKAVTIEYKAFNSCLNLSSANISNVVTIGDSVFGGCGNLGNVDISKVVTIGNSAFSGSKKFTSLILPDTLKTIGSYAFTGLNVPTTVPASVTSMGERVFDSAGSITLTFKCKVVGVKATYQSSVTRIILDGVEELSDEAFFYSESLTSINLGTSLKKIGYKALYKCNILLNIHIPASVEEIAPRAFNCETGSSDKNITIDPGNTKYTYVNDIIIETINTVKKIVFVKTSQSSFNFGDATEIGEYAFETCGSSLLKNGEYYTMTISSTVKKIHDYAFYDSYGIKKIIMTGVETIGDYAFNPSSELKDISIPSTVTKIGNMAFDRSKCPTITVDGSNTKYRMTSDMLEDIEDKKIVWATKNATSYNIPDHIEKIGNNAFYGCTSLTSVTLGASSNLKTIGDEAFSGCSALTTLGNIPPGLSSIGKSAFMNCEKLEIDISGTQLTEIPYQAFINCYKLNTEMPATLVTIGASSFKNCRVLTSVTFPATVRSVGSDAFYGCIGATVTINQEANDIDWSTFCSVADMTVSGTGRYSKDGDMVLDTVGTSVKVVWAKKQQVLSYCPQA